MARTLRIVLEPQAIRVVAQGIDAGAGSGKRTYVHTFDGPGFVFDTRFQREYRMKLACDDFRKLYKNRLTSNKATHRIRLL